MYSLSSISLTAFLVFVTITLRLALPIQKGHVHFFPSQSSTHSIPHTTHPPLPLWKMCPHGKTRMKSLSSYRSVQMQQHVCDSLCSSMEISDTRHTLSSYASTDDSRST